MKLYVKAASKKALNERIARGDLPWGKNYSVFGDGGDYPLDGNLPDGTTIAIFERVIGGNPVANSWGTWSAKAGRVK